MPRTVCWRRLSSFLLLLWWCAFVAFVMIALLENEAKKTIALRDLHRKERVLLDQNNPEFIINESDETENVDLNKPSQASESEIPFAYFDYPMNVNMTSLINEHQQKGFSDIKPINPFYYGYHTKAKNRCNFHSSSDKKDDVFLLFLIKSATENFDRRKAIRETWTKEEKIYTSKFKSVFLLGMSHNQTVNGLILSESIQYNDVVQMDFQDTYYSNTIKTMGGIHWSVMHCLNSKFVMVVDDDFFVATDSLLSYLNDLQSSNTDTLYMGNVFDFPRPYRSPKSKWHMSVAEYPYDKYPSFVSAGAILMSMEFVKKIHIAMQYTKKFIYDDIFMAIVVHKLGVIPIGNKRFHTIKVEYADTYFEDVLVSHGYGDPVDLRLAWMCSTKNICKKYKRSGGYKVISSLWISFLAVMLTYIYTN